VVSTLATSMNHVNKEISKLDVLNKVLESYHAYNAKYTGSSFNGVTCNSSTIMKTSFESCYMNKVWLKRLVISDSSSITSLNKSPVIVNLCSLINFTIGGGAKDVKSTIHRTVIKNSIIYNAIFNDTNFYDVLFSGCAFIDCLFENCMFGDNNMIDRCSFSNCDFVKCQNLSTKTIAINCNFKPANVLGSLAGVCKENDPSWAGYYKLKVGPNVIYDGYPKYFINVNCNLGPDKNGLLISGDPYLSTGNTASSRTTIPNIPAYKPADKLVKKPFMFASAGL